MIKQARQYRFLAQPEDQGLAKPGGTNSQQQLHQHTVAEKDCLNCYTGQGSQRHPLHQTAGGALVMVVW